MRRLVRCGGACDAAVERGGGAAGRWGGGCADLLGVRPSDGDAEELLREPAGIYEGALLFVTDISCNYRDSPYKGD